MTVQGAVGLRERKKERTHNDLLAAGLRLFAERGFNEVTVDDIAAEVDVSLRTFYRYFSSKEDLVLGDMDEPLEVLRRSFESQPPSLPIMAAVRAAILEVTRSIEPMAKDKMARSAIVEHTPSLLLRRAERHTAWEHVLTPLVASRLGDPDGSPSLEAQIIQP